MYYMNEKDLNELKKIEDLISEISVLNKELTDKILKRIKEEPNYRNKELEDLSISTERLIYELNVVFGLKISSHGFDSLNSDENKRYKEIYSELKERKSKILEKQNGL